MKETVLGSKLLTGCSLWKMDAYLPLRVDQRSNTLFREEFPGEGQDGRWKKLSRTESTPERKKQKRVRVF